jgi:hypothetical protein
MGGVYPMWGGFSTRPAACQAPAHEIWPGEAPHRIFLLNYTGSDHLPYRFNIALVPLAFTRPRRPNQAAAHPGGLVVSTFEMLS